MTGSAGAASGDGERTGLALGAADWLHLAAAPTFAIMTLLTAVLGGSADMLCSAGHGSPLTGMVPMYLLMSVFHLGPWLRLMSRQPRLMTNAAAKRRPASHPLNG